MPRRLAKPLDPSAVAGRPVTVRWDGREIQAREAEPLAVTLLASGRSTISRSFRFHRPRGLMCSTGQCGWCECEVDGVPSVRSCRVPVRDGLEARGEHARPSVGWDTLGVLDRANRLITPGFYHHRFLRPARLRKVYLDVIRWFGGRGRIRPGPRTTREASGAEAVIDADVAVVGAGPAGIAAAFAAAEAGARVIVVEADAAMSRTGDEADRERLGERLLLGTVAVAWDQGVLRVMSPIGPAAIRASVVIAATGSYERPPLVPGGDRPMVIGARTVWRLIEQWGVVPGERAALVGGGTDRAARALEAAGARIVARIPDAALTRIGGRDRVERVSWLEAGGRRSAAADLVVFGRRAPSLELPLLAGARVAWRDGLLAPVLDETGRTSAPWLFVVGSATGRADAALVSRQRAEAVGDAAAEAARTARMRAGPSAGPDRATMAASGQPNASIVLSETGGSAGAATHASREGAPGSALICYCEDVRVHDIRRERASGYDEPESLKRRTGGLTGPCQGKYCLDRFLEHSGIGPDASASPLLQPTARPPLRPIRLADLAIREDAP